MEINKDIIKRLANTEGYGHLEALMKEEMVKMRDVLNIKGEEGREINTEVIAKQEAYKMMERFFRRIGLIKDDIGNTVVRKARR